MKKTERTRLRDLIFDRSCIIFRKNRDDDAFLPRIHSEKKHVIADFPFGFVRTRKP